MTFVSKAALSSAVLQSLFASTLAQGGSWSAVIDFPIIPVAAFIVPEYPTSTRLMFYSAWSPYVFGGEKGYTQFAEYNYVTGAVSQREVAETKHDMFCPGMNTMADGRLIITGGSNAEKTSIYDPATNAWASGPDMRKSSANTSLKQVLTFACFVGIPRGYQSSTILSDGRVFTLGGSWSGARGGKTGEVYDPKLNTWTLLPGAAVEPILTIDNDGIFHSDNHAWLFPWRNGSVFQAGPSKAMNWYYTDGQGAVSPAGVRDAANDAMCGVHVMYDVGKIFSAGGAQSYGGAPGLANAHLIEINEVGAPANVVALPNMNYGRAFANVVVLPDGKILITGGQGYAEGFTDRDPVYIPELFDPVNRTFTKLAAEAIPRNYHSVSILLADGRVFSGGGGLCYDDGTGAAERCLNTVDHPNGQIFTPPYLTTNAPRPVIASIVASSIAPGGEFKITLGGSTAGVTFSLVRIGSVTHSVNSDQRRVPLTPRIEGTTVVLPILADSGVMLPGAWYLFAVSAQGVPSVARTVYVKQV